MVIEGSRAATLFQTVTVILSHYYLFSGKSYQPENYISGFAIASINYPNFQAAVLPGQFSQQHL
jgi:hypothetical protein